MVSFLLKLQITWKKLFTEKLKPRFPTLTNQQKLQLEAIGMGAFLFQSFLKLCLVHQLEESWHLHCRFPLRKVRSRMMELETPSGTTNLVEGHSLKSHTTTLMK